MIDLNPLVVERYKCKPPTYAPTSEYYATWYTIKGIQLQLRLDLYDAFTDLLKIRSHIFLEGWRLGLCRTTLSSMISLIVSKRTSMHHSV